MTLYEELVVLARSMPRLKRLVFRCHPDVFTTLRAACPEPEYGLPGGVFAGFGVEVIVDPEYYDGVWALFEDGKLHSAGRLSS